MPPKNDDILFTESQNLSDDAPVKNGNGHKETEDTSIRALEKHGIFLEKKKETTPRVAPPDDFRKKLSEVGGIEIIPNGDREI